LRIRETKKEKKSQRCILTEHAGTARSERKKKKLLLGKRSVLLAKYWDGEGSRARIAFARGSRWGVTEKEGATLTCKAGGRGKAGRKVRKE